MIKTSVIIPVYNTELYIEECIESVYNQNGKDIEVIAINDGSTDNSYRILQKLQKKYTDLIILSQENHGLGYTRNIGLNMAKGEYVFFLDSDDYISEDMLETCYNYASKNELDILLFDAFNFEDSYERRPIIPNTDDRREIISNREEVMTGIDFMEKYDSQQYGPSACFVYCSLEFLRKNNVQFLPRVYFEDNEFHCRIMLLADRVMYIPRMFYQRRCRGNSITGTDFDLRKAKDHLEVINAITELKPLNGCKGWHVVRRINRNLLTYVAVISYKNHLYAKDKKLFSQIFKAWVKMMK